MPKPRRRAYAEAARALRLHADPKKAKVHRGFFKNPGDDIFLGVSTPLLRALAREFQLLPFPAVRRLMKSRVHDERSLGCAILRKRYEKGDETDRKQVFDFYLRNRLLVSSWDAVDDTAPSIVGSHLLRGSKKLLYRLAKSRSLWERRSAMVSTLTLIRNGKLTDTLRLAKILLRDEEDLIHKATGWMLREVGKKDPEALRKFLKVHCVTMPRTMLRYAIERFPERERQMWLKRKG